MGAEHKDARGPEQRIADEASDRLVEAGHGGQAREFRVGHSLGHQDRRKNDPGHEISTQPRAVVVTDGPYSGNPRLDLG